MQWLFKTVGLALVFCVCVLTGYLKSLALKGDCDRLFSLTRSTEQLADYIRADGGEIIPLVCRCYDSQLVKAVNGKIAVSREFMSKDAAKLLEELFCGIGMRERVAEYERTRLYASLLEKQYFKASQRCAELCRLYNTLGLLCGAFLCIFFL